LENLFGKREEQSLSREKIHCNKDFERDLRLIKHYFGIESVPKYYRRQIVLKLGSL